MLDRIVKSGQDTRLKPAEYDRLAPLLKYSVYDLKRIASQPRPRSEACLREEETQQARQHGKFQIIYRQQVLIPLDPKVTPDSECDSRSQIKLSLGECYDEWMRQQREKARQQDIAHELIGMLEKGLFRVSADMVFKVIARINVEYLLQGHQRQELSDLIDSKDFQG